MSRPDLSACSGLLSGGPTTDRPLPSCDVKLTASMSHPRALGVAEPTPAVVRPVSKGLFPPFGRRIGCRRRWA